MTIKKYYKQFFTAAMLIFSSVSFSLGIDPTFNMTVKNITHVYGNNGQDSVITFELYMQQTNQGQPNVYDFEYCAGQFAFRYNPAIHSPGGNLILGLVPGASDLPPSLRPPSFKVDSLNGYLQASGNIPQAVANYFISGSFPGSKILTFKIRTNNKAFNMVPLNLRFKLGSSPNTFLAYFQPYPDSVDSETFPFQTAVALLDTVVNHYSVEDSVSNSGINLVSPLHGSVTARKNIEFSWNNISGANTYKLQIAADAGFNNIVFTDSAITDTFKTVSGLNVNSQYYWQVLGKNDSAYFIGSSVWTFNTTAVQVTLFNPPDNSSFITLPVLFSWTSAEIVNNSEPIIAAGKEFDNIVFNADYTKGLLSDLQDNDLGVLFTYKLEVSDDQNFNNVVFIDSVITSPFQSVNNLKTNSVYYWKVTPKNDSFYTVASEVWSFNTNPRPAVTLLSPANNAVNVPTMFDFKWYKSANALNYTLQISADSLMSSFIVNDSLLTDTFKTVSNLNYLTDYYWRVKAKFSADSIPVSDEWKFRTIDTATGILPTFNMVVKNIQTTQPGTSFRDSIMTFELYLHQTNQGQPNVYDFEYAASQFTFYYNKAIHSPGGDLKFGLSASGNALPPSLRPPSFMVDSANGLLRASGNLPNSLANFFISGTFPGTRILTFRIVTNKNMFNFVPLNLRFKLGATPNTFTAFYLPYPDSVDSNLFPAQTSVALLDTIENHYAVENPEYILPVEFTSFTSNVIRDKVALHWSTSSELNNSGFDIERSAAEGDWTKAGSVSGSGSTNETKNYSFNDKVTSGKYKYRLKQIDFNGSFNYHYLSDEINVGMPMQFNLSQNYPNPFNPVTKIDLELPSDGNVNLIVYDISGREVSKLLNGFKPAGYYTVDFNASELASGIYFYMIKAGEFQATKRMVVVK